MRAGGGIEVEVVSSHNLRKLESNLRLLTVKAQKKVWRPALRAGAKIQQRRAKQLAPHETGALEAAIKVRAGKRSRSKIGKGTVSAMATLGAKELFKGDSFYGAFVELGHKVGKRGSRAKGAGEDTRPFVEGEFFLARAADGTRTSAARRVMRKVSVGTIRTTRKIVALAKG